MLRCFLLVSFLFILVLLRKALLPLAIGIVLAYLLDPLVSVLQEKFHMKRILAIFLAYLCLLFVIVFLLFSFANMAGDHLPKDSWSTSLAVIKDYIEQNRPQIESILPFIKDLPSTGEVLRQISNIFIKGFLALVISIYLLNDKATFLRIGQTAFHLLFTQKLHGHVRELFYEMNQVLAAFVRGVFIDSVLVSLLASLILTLLQIDYAILLGCFIGITNIIPYFGPVIGILPAVFLAFTHGGWTKAIIAAGGLVLIQQLECNIIYPRIIGNSTGLHPLFVLLAVSVAGYYGGLVSMILAVPIAGVLKVLFCKWAESR